MLHVFIEHSLVTAGIGAIDLLLAEFSYSSGTDARQLSAREAASYVTARNKLFQYASVIMSDAGEKRLEVNRLETGLGDFFAFSDRWLGLQYFQYQEIPAVGVESRLTSITGAGMRITHNRVMDLALLSGIALQRETPAGESARGTQTELPLVVDWELGIPRYETKLSAVAILYQGLSETGRQRLDFRVNLDHELFENFTIGLQYLYNYDTEPLNRTDRSRVRPPLSRQATASDRLRSAVEANVLIGSHRRASERLR